MSKELNDEDRAAFEHFAVSVVALPGSKSWLDPLEVSKAASGWVLDVFKPLPPEEAASLREYLDSGEV